MLFGLMLGYVIFAAMSWLVMQSFGIAAGFVFRAGGWSPICSAWSCFSAYSCCWK